VAKPVILTLTLSLKHHDSDIECLTLSQSHWLCNIVCHWSNIWEFTNICWIATEISPDLLRLVSDAMLNDINIHVIQQLVTYLYSVLNCQLQGHQDAEESSTNLYLKDNNYNQPHCNANNPIQLCTTLKTISASWRNCILVHSAISLNCTKDLYIVWAMFTTSSSIRLLQKGFLILWGKTITFRGCIQLVVSCTVLSFTI